jgi:pimeloyl-ACP methyl ester carboxylesterase
MHDLDGFRRERPQWYSAFNAYCRSRSLVPHVKRTMYELLRVGTQQIPDAELDRISCPTALVWGRHDRMVNPHLAQGASSRHGWPLAMLDRAAHVPHMEQPEAFVRALDELATSPRRHHQEAP